MTAKRSGVAQPAPRLLQPPSPTAGNHGTSFNAGQRLVAAEVAVEVSLNGTRLPSLPFRRQAQWQPDGPGQVRITVLDGAGRSASVAVWLQ